MIETMGGGSLVAGLLEASVKSTGLALVVWLGLTVCRARSARLRCIAWWTVLCNMLLLLPAKALLAGFELPVPLPLLRAPVTVQPAPAVPEAALAVGAAGLDALPGAATALLAVYLLGVGAMLLRTGRAAWATRAVLRGARPIEDRHWIERCRELAGSISWSRPTLWTCPAIRVPFTVGVLRPRILLPEAWHGWDPALVESVLAHELEHVRRRDYLLNLLLMMNRCLYWFHPLAWSLSRQLSALTEKVCDEAAIRVVGKPRLYAQHLLQVAAALADGRGRIVIGIAMAGSSRLKDRIEAILSEKEVSAGRSSRALGAGVVLLIACAALLIVAGRLESNPTRETAPEIAAALPVAAPGPVTRPSLEEERPLGSGSSAPQRAHTPEPAVRRRVEGRLRAESRAPEPASLESPRAEETPGPPPIEETAEKEPYERPMEIAEVAPTPVPSLALALEDRQDHPETPEPAAAPRPARSRNPFVRTFRFFFGGTPSPSPSPSSSPSDSPSPSRHRPWFAPVQTPPSPSPTPSPSDSTSPSPSSSPSPTEPPPAS